MILPLTHLDGGVGRSASQTKSAVYGKVSLFGDSGHNQIDPAILSGIRLRRKIFFASGELD